MPASLQLPITSTCVVCEGTGVIPFPAIHRETGDVQIVEDTCLRCWGRGWTEKALDFDKIKLERT